MTPADPGRRVEVVLDDRPASSGGPDGSGRTHGPTLRRSGRARRRPWYAAGLLLALVGGLGAVEARADRRERAALAEFAEVPGVVGSLAEPLTESWRLPVFPTLTATGDVVVAVEDTDVVGLDVATGERRWSLTREAGSNRPTCLPTAPGDAAVPWVLCTGLQSAGVGGWDALDVRTGARGGSAGSLLAIAPVDDGALVIRPGATTVLTAALLEPRDLPDQRDVPELRAGVDGDPGRGDGPVPERWSVPLDVRGDVLGALRVHGDRQVVALESRTTVVLDARDGRALGRWVAASDGVAPAVARVVSHPGAGFGVWESRFAGRWYAPDGTAGTALDGEPIEPDVDDGRTPEVVLLGSAAGDRVRAVDVVLGEELWDRPAPGRVLLRLGGRLVVTAGERLEAWDATTGEAVWSVPLDPTEVPDLDGPWTDGVRLVVRGEDDDGLRLAAYRLTDGARVWRSPLPAGSRSVAVLGDRLVAVGRFDGRTDSAAVLG